MRSLVVLGFLTLMGVGDLEGQTRPCQPPGPKAAELRTRAISIVTDSIWANLRTRLGVVAGDTSTVSVVISDAVCNSVTSGVDVKSEDTPRATSLIVVKFQSFFLACDPEGDAITASLILDAAYDLKSVITAG